MQPFSFAKEKDYGFCQSDDERIKKENHSIDQGDSQQAVKGGAWNEDLGQRTSSGQRRFFSVHRALMCCQRRVSGPAKQ